MEREENTFRREERGEGRRSEGAGDGFDGLLFEGLGDVWVSKSAVITTDGTE